jgi:hypothetical protein
MAAVTFSIFTSSVHDEHHPVCQILHNGMPITTETTFEVAEVLFERVAADEMHNGPVRLALWDGAGKLTRFENAELLLDAARDLWTKRRTENGEV